MKLPFEGSPDATLLSPPVLPEPPRRGEDGGEPCGVCGRDDAIWSDEHWAVYVPFSGSIPGTVWIASHVHADSFQDLPGEVAASFGTLIARTERAILGLGGFARVHLYRWGDGGAHFHVWLMPRPAGMLDAAKYALPVWEEVLPPAEDAEHEKAGRLIAEALRAA
ncbi:hypothetical protein Afil01_68920 [Actinorhabdospora filicis]|uniref:Diadenosine tetraphosphate (Ap4A) HIT family hydrolase n=1 Tax=Actinorhabdospora filicis TaxID=1785913 RepID=A0A9W6WEQ1_9ACTN|nr:hypothetical protein [Actinorhabdospora filicis]GLZ82085.1 hypothetical protein Afil01_68920 [Actinorhabdospora filicis]